MTNQKQELSGIQKWFLACLCGATKGCIEGYCELSEEDRKEWNRRTANRMLNKALKGEIEEPYSELEIKFIKENLI